MSDLTVWQKRFPDIFTDHPHILNAAPDVQSKLARILNELNSKGLIHKTTLSSILKRWYGDYSNNDGNEFFMLMDNIGKQALNAQILDNILNQIQYHVGLSRALDLFNLSELDYHENWQDLIMLNALFEDPLCRVIFDARLRSFGLYSIVSEPINVSFARTLIHTLKNTTKENRVRVFFDVMCRERPMPCAQKRNDDDDITVEEALVRAFNTYCQMNEENYMSIYTMLRAAIRDRADQRLLHLIQHEAGATIEENDLYSLRNYTSLMDEISQGWQQLDLNILKKNLEESHEYQRVAVHALIKRSSSMTLAPTTPGITDEDQPSQHAASQPW